MLNGYSDVLRVGVNRGSLVSSITGGVTTGIMK